MWIATETVLLYVPSPTVYLAYTQIELTPKITFNKQYNNSLYEVAKSIQIILSGIIAII